MDKAYTEAKKLLGEEGLASRIVLVFTCGDLLRQKNVDFEAQLKQSFGDLGQMLEDAGDRYILFNNNAVGEESRKQLERLLELVRSAQVSFLTSTTQEQIEKIIKNESEKLSKNKNMSFEDANYLIRKEMAEAVVASEKLTRAISHVDNGIKAHGLTVQVNLCAIL